MYKRQISLTSTRNVFDQKKYCQSPQTSRVYFINNCRRYIIYLLNNKIRRCQCIPVQQLHIRNIIAASCLSSYIKVGVVFPSGQSFSAKSNPDIDLGSVRDSHSSLHATFLIHSKLIEPTFN